MSNFDQLTLLNHQWNDFNYRLKILVRLLSQYDVIRIKQSRKISFHYIDSYEKQSIHKKEEQRYGKERIYYELLTVNKTKQEQIDKYVIINQDIQLTNDNIIEKANKRLDVIRSELVDIQTFLNSIQEWKKMTFKHL